MVELKFENESIRPEKAIQPLESYDGYTVGELHILNNVRICSAVNGVLGV